MYRGSMVTNVQHHLHIRDATCEDGPDKLALISDAVMIAEQLGHFSGSKVVSSGFQK